MKKYRIYIFNNKYRTSDTYIIIAKDKLNAVKQLVLGLINEPEIQYYNIDDIDIQYIEELIENDEL